MTLGNGCAINSSSKQKINTRSSTEAELVGVNDALTMVIWVRLFLEAQGFQVNENIVYQDNQSAILLENNGRRSSGKKTRHIDIRYYFITDNVKRGVTTIQYCPTEDMVGDFYTKPLQGALFRKFRAIIMGLDMAHTPSTEPLCEPRECVGAEKETSAPVEVGSTPAVHLSWAEVAGSKLHAGNSR